MKQFLFLFFTVCGICRSPAQSPLPDSLQDISTNKTAISSPKVSIRLSPNPVKNKLSIALEGFAAGPVRLQLFDAGGTLQRNETRRLFDGNEVVTMMFFLPPGIYFLLLSQDGRSYKRKLLVN